MKKVFFLMVIGFAGICVHAGIDPLDPRNSDLVPLRLIQEYIAGCTESRVSPSIQLLRVMGKLKPDRRPTSYVVARVVDEVRNEINKSISAKKTISKRKNTRGSKASFKLVFSDIIETARVDSITRDGVEKAYQAATAEYEREQRQADSDRRCRQQSVCSDDEGYDTEEQIYDDEDEDDTDEQESDEDSDAY